MRTIVDIPEELLIRLDQVKEQHQCSRAALIREAIDSFLKKQLNPSDFDQYFGTWNQGEVDGLQLQEELREDWDRK